MLRFFFFFFLLFSLSLKANPRVSWSHVYDGERKDTAYKVELDFLGFVYSYGTTESLQGTKLLTRKYSRFGEIQWTRLGEAPIPGSVILHARDTSFNTYLVVKRYNLYNLIKYGREGSLRWVASVDHKPIGLHVQNSKVFLAGQSSRGFYAKIHDRSDGKILWAVREDRGRKASGFLVDSTDNIYVGGTDNSIEESQKFHLVKFSESNEGSWSLTMSPEGGNNSIKNLKLDSKGNLYFSGEINGHGSMMANVSVAKVNSKGKFLWSRLISRAGGSIAGSIDQIHVDKEDNLVVVGTEKDFYNTNPDGITSRIYLAKVDKNSGEKLFHIYPNDPRKVEKQIFETVQTSTLDKYGSIFIANSRGEEEDQWEFLKTDKQGRVQWLVEGRATHKPRVTSIAISRSKIFLSLTEKFSSTYDHRVIALTQNGLRSSP